MELPRSGRRGGEMKLQVKVTPGDRPSFTRYLQGASNDIGAKRLSAGAATSDSNLYASDAASAY